MTTNNHLPDEFFRELTPAEVDEFKTWARDWHLAHPFDRPSHLWHPIVRTEIRRIRIESPVKVYVHGWDGTFRVDPTPDLTTPGVPELYGPLANVLNDLAIFFDRCDRPFHLTVDRES